ncbi:hypothetical protein FHX81_6906 [Saccharothrix saharensis]|uniref:Uncharacterized protein n=1 Tax=Saccharothrix saharensis TaxID=571190 RepID=A0A543JNQ8_9PSEU|nr:hypothetical protein [Saccharothrix saharensis]TQM84460.1 hypothetical protein FHX81_6906 [Saccharothrix saharensis]
MIFREAVLAEAAAGYHRLTEYYRDIRAFFEVLSVRFALPEYGVRLRPVGGNELFSNANSYLLSDESAYPYYLWTPTWLGRSYVDADHVPEGQAPDDLLTARTRLIAFVWPWLGFNDAYVEDAAQPECWFGVAEPHPDDDTETVHVTAQSLFNFFRLERTFEAEVDGWLTGNFRSHVAIGCNLTGHWFLRRVPLATLTSYYQVEQRVIRPIGEKFAALRHAPAERRHDGHAPALDMVVPQPR